MSIVSKTNGLARPGRRLDLHGAAAAVILGLLAAAPLMLGHAVAVWRDDMFFDPDDAMRTVQVRDFLAGQGWFDLVPHRLSPDHPFVMHWSRLADLPLALGIDMLSWFTGFDRAERLTRVLEPIVCMAAFLAIILHPVRGLLGREAQWPAALLVAASLELTGSFLPGHVHHHGLQLVLLAAITAGLLDGLEPGRAAATLLAGFAAALSLGIGLQNLPFLVAAGAVVAALWIVRGRERAGTMVAFGLGLAAGALLLFPLDRPMAGYAETVCDAFSVVHLVAALGVGAGFAGLAAAGRHLSGVAARAAATAGLALALGLVMAELFPACLGDPYVAVDPLLRREWLSQVTEAMPFATLVRDAPLRFLPIGLALAAGFAATVAAWKDSTGHKADGWTVPLALAAVGLLGTVWEMRVSAATQVFLIPGMTRAALAFAHHRDRDSQNSRLPLVLAGSLLMTQIGWTALMAAVGIFGNAAAAAAAPADDGACFRPASYAALGALPPGIVLSTIDPGPTILAATRHAVLAAPYHRNTYGNGVALRAFMASEGDAETIVRSSGATYVAICRQSSELRDWAGRDPDNLAGRLLAHRAPPWLTPVGAPGHPVEVYAVGP